MLLRCTLRNKFVKVYGDDMDRRQRKSRQAIFAAFTELLDQKDFGQITVGEIIDRADVGRATFYAHFETKEFLLKELCQELFCHIFDATRNPPAEHQHIFRCEPTGCVFQHLFVHLQKNDNGVLRLLSCRNNELFLGYFKTCLRTLVASQLTRFQARRDPKLPEGFWVNHITATFIETLRWWIETGMEQTPETITEYFYLSV